MAMYTPGGKINLNDHQLKIIDKYLKDEFKGNPCLEIPLGDYKTCMLPRTVKEENNLDIFLDFKAIKN